MRTKSTILLSFIFLMSCVKVKDDSVKKIFKSPLKSYQLPSSLSEVSGLSFYSEKELILINDEEGILFYFDLLTETVLRSINFNVKGDFEGVSLVDDIIYVLASEGILYKVNTDNEVSSIRLFDGKYNLEGLCYHEKRNSLLIACKEHPKKKKNDYIQVFEYNLSKEKIEKNPYLKLDKSELSKKFKPSGLALHPNGNLFIVSAANESFIEIGKDSKILNYLKLPKKSYPQVEGIAIDKLGNLFLASEKANMDHAYLYKIEY
ncbi:MAG: SdiA-regulated domain-containing protein [Flavobacteriales bacterium]|nr:SdiA-regulated domain-containing protein [Flavobacteriales bacterium]